MRKLKTVKPVLRRLEERRMIGLTGAGCWWATKLSPGATPVECVFAESTFPLRLLRIDSLGLYTS
jgi:hypothetical protein